MLFRSVLLASSILAATPALAEETPPAPADTNAAEPAQRGDHSDARADIIVTAPYEQAQADILSGTSVLTGQALTRDLRPSIGDTLARLPGVSASSFGPSSSRPILRGFSGDRVRVLIDGIGSIDASTNSVDHAPVINPLTADRIEVLRGPSALLFGSSAIGGVVNVIDNRIPRAMPTEAVHVDAIGTYGSAAEERSAAGEIDVPIAGKIVAHLDGSYLRTDDLRTGGYLLSPQLRRLAAASDEAEVRENAGLRGRLPNTASETWEVAGGLSVVTDRGHLGFSVSRYESLYGVPGRIEFAHEEGDDHDHGDEEHGHEEEEGHSHENVRLNLKQTRFDVRGEVETDGGFLDRIRLRLAAADYRHDEIEESGEIGTSFFNQGYEGRLELVQRARGGWKGASGAQMFIRDFDVQGEEKFVPRNTTEQFGVFTLQSLDLGRFRVEGGARYERTSLTAQADADLETPRYERSFDAVSASLGASYQLADGVRVGLNGSRSERAPSAEELFASGPHAGTQAFEIGDPNFVKEKSWGLEATLRGSAPGLSFALAGYYNWFNDYIYQSPTGEEVDELPVFVYAQADARVWGFEAEARADLATFGATRVSIDGLADYVRTTITGVGPAPRIPPLRVLGGLEANSDRLNGRVEVEHVFDQDRVTAFELPTEGYTMVNASVAFRPFGPGNATSLTLSANNIFDVEARRHASFLKDFAPLAGRDIRATLRFQI
ncbi:TonB-dependent receptor [Sphingomonas spermidinifaciens]|uniref:TonB-dependent receptor n=1 Tax=Sphingomonas spermidinifaciens TaxID=1141889 RepID=A0A2A4AZ90_9SPHN|nr:TonB-dependent receptor [Sphingomonas spermidinifaciens]PCD02263.1 TonB-dependent receptor [Sphingomonas spermidinifaciens]